MRNMAVVQRPALRFRRNLAELHDECDWARADGTTLFRETARSRSRWWTFGGARANRALAHALDRAGLATMAVDDLSIGLRGTATLDAITAITDAADPTTLRTPVEPRRLDAIKFASCILGRRPATHDLRARRGRAGGSQSPSRADQAGEPVAAATTAVDDHAALPAAWT